MSETGGAARRRAPSPAQVASVALGLAAALTYSDYLIDVVLRPAGVDQLAVISHLEAPGAPYSSLLRAADIAAGLLSIALAAFLLRALPRGWVRLPATALLVVFGVCGALTGLIPDPCPNPDSGCGGSGGAAQRSLHVLLSGWTDVSLLLCPLVVAAATWRRGPRWVTATSGAAFALMLLTALVYRSYVPLDLSLPRGLLQRAVVSSGSLWLLVVGVIGALAPSHRGTRADRSGSGPADG